MKVNAVPLMLRGGEVVSAQRTITSEEICLFSLWVRVLDSVSIANFIDIFLNLKLVS